MSTGGGYAAAAGTGGARPAPILAQSESTREKKDLAGWWKNFKRGDKKVPEQGTSR
jgi:chitinase